MVINTKQVGSGAQVILVILNDPRKMFASSTLVRQMFPTSSPRISPVSFELVTDSVTDSVTSNLLDQDLVP